MPILLKYLIVLIKIVKQFFYFLKKSIFEAIMRYLHPFATNQGWTLFQYLTCNFIWINVILKYLYIRLIKKLIFKGIMNKKLLFTGIMNKRLFLREVMYKKLIFKEIINKKSINFFAVHYVHKFVSPVTLLYFNKLTKLKSFLKMT